MCEWYYWLSHFFFSSVLTCHGRQVSTCLGHWELCGYSYGYCSIMIVQPQHRMRFLFLYQRWVIHVLVSANIFLKCQVLWQINSLYVFEVFIYSVFSVFTFHKLLCVYISWIMLWSITGLVKIMLTLMDYFKWMVSTI